MKAAILKITALVFLVWLFIFKGLSDSENIQIKSLSPAENLYYTYSEVLYHIENEHFGKLTPDQIKAIREIQEESLSAIVSELDKHSRYHKSEQWKEIQENSRSKFGGVGLTLDVPDLSKLDEKLTAIVKEKIPGFGSEESKNPDFLKAIYKWIGEINPEAKELSRRIKERIIPKKGILIEEVASGGPAEKAGLKKGWYITKIDGKRTEGMALKDAIKLIKGPSGTKVKLTLAPPGKKRNKTAIKETEITREIIETSVITIEKAISDKIGYIKFGGFYEGVGEDFKNSLLRLKISGDGKLILDLRSNPGGRLDEAGKVLGALLPEGRIAIYILERNGELTPLYSLPQSKTAKIFSGKIVVLINENSASASELVAISLKEQVRAVIIGKKSYGKSSIQSLFILSDDSCLRLTTSHYLSPVFREDIEKKGGIIPDIEIGDDPNTPEDEVLEKAIEILKK